MVHLRRKHCLFWFVKVFCHPIVVPVLYDFEVKSCPQYSGAGGMVSDNEAYPPLLGRQTRGEVQRSHLVGSGVVDVSRCRDMCPEVRDREYWR